MKGTPAGDSTRPAQIALAAFFMLAWAPGLTGCDAPRQSEAAPGASVVISGDHVQVEIARTPEEQSLGLGERNALAWGHGMLFLYDKPGFPRFWMKGMRFDIDIVWILGDRIAEISHRVPHVPGENGPTLIPLCRKWEKKIPSGRAVAHLRQTPSSGGAPGALALAQAFLDRVKFSKGFEAMTKTFVDNVVSIHDRMLVVPQIRSLLLHVDETFGVDTTPFDTVNKLHIVLTKASSEDKIQFVIESLIWLCSKSGLLG